MASKRGAPVTESEDNNQNNVKVKKKKYLTSYNQAWEKDYPWLSSVQDNRYAFFCKFCCCKRSCAGSGKGDVERHSKTHNEDAMKATKRTEKMRKHMPSEFDPITQKIIKAEVLATHFIAEHNLPIAVADHFTPLVKKMFPDSNIAKGFSCGKIKARSILNYAIGPHYIRDVVAKMKNYPFSLAVDGSNDTDLKKMNPLTVRIYDINRGYIATRFVDMGMTSGSDAESIFQTIASVFQKNNLSWGKCIGFSVDNTNVNMGNRNSIKTRVLGRNENCFILGCPCHIIHNAASYSATNFGKVVGFDIEEFLIDLYYWYDKSTNRKNTLAEFCEFVDIDYRKIIKHVSTRWLTMLQATDRTLKQYPALKSYFLSTDESQARFQRLKKRFEDPMTEVYLLFFQSTLPSFDYFNLIFQREEPCINILDSEMKKLLKNVMSKFILPRHIKSAASLLSVDLSLECQKDDKDVQIGFVTKQTLTKLQNAGDLNSESVVSKFYKGVRSFFTKAVNYMISNLPFANPVIENAAFTDFATREEATLDQVHYFVERFSGALDFTDQEINSIEEQFNVYQLLENDEIPDEVIEDAKIITTYRDGGKSTHLRMDKIWAYLHNFKDSSGMYSFKLLASVAFAVLSLPHSNASEERVFSCVRKNKTAFRASMEDETIGAIISVKLNEDKPCHKVTHDKKLLAKAKSSTKDYNRKHSSIHSQNDKDDDTINEENSNEQSEIDDLGNASSTTTTTDNQPQNQPSMQTQETATTHNQPSLQPASGKSSLKNMRLPTALIDSFLEAAQENSQKDVETLAFLAGLDGNSYIVTDLLIPKQTGTQNTCSTTDEQEMLDFLDQQGLICLGWIHTHPSQSSFLSSVDLHMQFSLQQLLPAAVAIVCSLKDKVNSIYNLSAQGMDVLSKCTAVASTFHPHPVSFFPLFKRANHIILDDDIELQSTDLRV